MPIGLEIGIWIMESDLAAARLTIIVHLSLKD